MSSLTFSDLSTSTAYPIHPTQLHYNASTSPTTLLQATCHQDKAELSETISITYQILLLTYQTTPLPSLADVLNGHKQYFLTNDHRQDQNERTYQYILDLSLSSEQDWWSKLEVESKSKKNNRGHREKGGALLGTLRSGGAFGMDSNSESDDSSHERNLVSPLLAWAAMFWLDTSFSSRTFSFPEQIVTVDSQQDLVDFQTQYPGLNSQMQLQGRRKDQPHWWTGRSSSGLSLYLSSAVTLHKFQLTKHFKQWERHAAMNQWDRYRKQQQRAALYHIFKRKSFNEWKMFVHNEGLLDSFAVHKHFRRWTQWLNKAALRIPFLGWATETRRWRQKLIAFHYWCHLSFTRQKKLCFNRWAEYKRMDALGHCFVHWSNVADHAWSNRQRFKMALNSVEKIRHFRIKAWVLNGWNSYILNFHHCKEGMQRLFHVVKKIAQKKIIKAFDAWHHAYMIDVHAHFGTLVKSGSGSRILRHNQLHHHRVRIEKRIAQTFVKSVCGRCWGKWRRFMVNCRNQTLLHDTAIHHHCVRLVGHSFFKWNLVLVEKRRRLRRERLATTFRFQHLCRKYFYLLIIHLIKARQEKIKRLEAIIHCNRRLLEKYYVQWWKRIQVDKHATSGQEFETNKI